MFWRHTNTNQIFSLYSLLDTLLLLLYNVKSMEYNIINYKYIMYIDPNIYICILYLYMELYTIFS